VYGLYLPTASMWHYLDDEQHYTTLRRWDHKEQNLDLYENHLFRLKEREKNEDEWFQVNKFAQNHSLNKENRRENLEREKWVDLLKMKELLDSNEIKLRPAFSVYFLLQVCRNF
jgi:hypothetical protein